MRRNGVVTVAVVLWLCVQMGMVAAPGARAEEPTRAADLSAGAISVIATAIAVPVRLVACGATIVLGGMAYGLTMGTSELLREELAAGTNYTCGGKFTITPQEVKRLARKPER